MEEASKLVVGILVTFAGLAGLFLAARADAGIQIFGLLLAGFAVFMDFWLIKRHFDELEGAPAEAGGEPVPR